MGIGVSHIGLSVERRADVGAMQRHLAELGVRLLGEGKVEMGYRRGYCCLLFEDPDCIIIEIAWHEPRDFSPLPR